jgi:hypothetical protein
MQPRCVHNSPVAEHEHVLQPSENDLTPGVEHEKHLPSRGSGGVVVEQTDATLSTHVPRTHVCADVHEAPKLSPQHRPPPPRTQNGAPSANHIWLGKSMHLPASEHDWPLLQTLPVQPHLKEPMSWP